MLFDARPYLATIENAHLIIEKLLPKLPRPHFSFSYYQVRFTPRYNNTTGQFDAFEFAALHLCNLPELNPELFRFVLEWSDKGWRVMSPEDFKFIFQ